MVKEDNSFKSKISFYYTQSFKDWVFFMSNLENKLKKIVNTFNNINKEKGYRDIKKLSEKYKEEY